jgi:hypothetical protein
MSSPCARVILALYGRAGVAAHAKDEKMIVGDFRYMNLHVAEADRPDPRLVERDMVQIAICRFADSLGTKLMRLQDVGDAIARIVQVERLEDPIVPQRNGSETLT